MKKTFLIFILGFAAFMSFAQNKQVYSVFTSDGKATDYMTMLNTLSKSDVILIGETHNCPVAHWIEYELTKDIIRKYPEGLVLGAEMFEADNQLLVDEYTSGLISSERFEKEAKLWDNYWTDYVSLLFFAREHSLKFVATNVPRRYASFVKEKGLEALQGLSEQARSYIAPLPIAFEKTTQDETMYGFMQMFGGGGTTKSYFAEAQAIKDATMAWFISQNFDRKFIHYNGNFHSDNKGGIIPYLAQYLPGKSVVSVCCIRQDEISSLEEENMSRADFIVVAPTDFPMSY